MVEDGYDAGVSVLLKELDSYGDWVTVTGWEDVDSDFAGVGEDYAVDKGTYKLEVMHKAYDPDDHTTPLEIHYTESVEVTIN